ncbi:MAG: asparagine synthase C-terminal domain-containing protein [Nitrososphaerales archaeon]
MGSLKPDSITAIRGKDFDSTVLELRRLVFKAVEDTLGDSILLSGGLDTSIIAAIAASVLEVSEKKKFHTYTVILKETPGPDLIYSKLVASRFGFPHHIRFVRFSELEAILPEVIRVLRSFDPMEIRNSVTVYLGLREAKLGCATKIMTGDASDELFAGYNFVLKLQRDVARETLVHLWEVMHFSSIPLAESLGIEARLPFLESGVKQFATKGVDFDYLVGGREVSGELFGKYVLRKAFEDMLPAEIVWRKKTPIEYGSGTAMLSAIYAEKIKDSEYEGKKRQYFERDGVKLRDKEQLRYYEQ